MQGYFKTEGVSFKQILFYTEPYSAVGVVLSDEGIAENEEHRKVIKAGTPLVGDIENRDTVQFTPVKGNASKVVGVLLHDADVTNGPDNATCVIFGYIDLNKVEDDVKALITDDVKKTLSAKVTFMK